MCVPMQILYSYYSFFIKIYHRKDTDNKHDYQRNEYRTGHGDRPDIARINELARKKHSDGLTTEETAEQKKLYAEYLGNIRGQMKQMLDSIEYVDDTKAVKH